MCLPREDALSGAVEPVFPNLVLYIHVYAHTHIYNVVEHIRQYIHRIHLIPADLQNLNHQGQRYQTLLRLWSFWEPAQPHNWCDGEKREGGLNPTPEKLWRRKHAGLRINMACFGLFTEQANCGQSIDRVCQGLLRKMISHRRPMSENQSALGLAPSLFKRSFSFLMRTAPVCLLKDEAKSLMRLLISPLTPWRKPLVRPFLIFKARRQ